MDFMLLRTQNLRNEIIPNNGLSGSERYCVFFLEKLTTPLELCR
jgi:hypothetical protein